MSEDLDRDIGFIEGRMVDIVSDLEKVTKTLVGNSKPGLLTRQANMEKDIQSLLGAAKGNNDAIKDLTRVVDGLCRDVHVHMNDKDVHTWRMFLRKDIIASILVVFLVLNQVLDGAGSALTYLRAWLGI